MLLLTLTVVSWFFRPESRRSVLAEPSAERKVVTERAEAA
jgi:hypothetical protein